MTITAKERKVLLKSLQGELDAIEMYQALAKAVKDPREAATFRQLAAEEGRHAAVFKAMTNELLQPKRSKAIVIPILYRVIGKKKLYPIIARGEYAAVKKYEPVAARFPEVEAVQNDEQRHGDTVLALL